MNKTGSVWAYITSHESEFTNSLYDPNSHKTSPRLAIHPSQVTLWTGTTPSTRTAASVVCVCVCAVQILTVHLLPLVEYYLRWATAAANEQVIKEITIQLASTPSPPYDTPFLEGGLN